MTTTTCPAPPRGAAAHPTGRAPRPGLNRRRAFTLIEMLVGLTVAAAIVGIASFSLVKVRAGSEAHSATVTLSAAQVAGREVAAHTSYTFPANLAAQVTAAGLTFTTGASTSTSVVSVDELSTTRAVYAVQISDGRCVVMLDDLATAGATYAMTSIPPTAGCSATAAAVQSSSITGPATTPATITF